MSLSQDVRALSEKNLTSDHGDVLSAAAELVRKEIAALRRLHVRHAAESASFRKSVVAFYGGFASQVATRLGVTKQEAKAWCKKRSDRICAAEDIVSVIDSLESELDAADTASSSGEQVNG